MKRYLDLISLDDAKNLIERSFSYTCGYETIPVDKAEGRITARPVFAQFSSPQIHISAMDGIAVRSADTVGAYEQHPVTLPTAHRVNTGNVIPPGFDAVVMIEHVEIEGDKYTVRAAVSPWQHIRPVGEDLGESEMIIPSAHRIRPHEIGALAAYGVNDVDVLSLSIGLIPTGSELVPLGVRPEPGQVVESNMYMAASYLRSLGARCTHYPIVPDDPDLIREAMMRGIAENDLLIVSAGSSKGTRDYTASLIGELGEVLVHGVAIKPAKPVIIGRIEGKPVIGMPGYPLATYTILREILTPMMRQYGFQPPVASRIRARVSATLHSEIGTDEFVLLSVGRIGERWAAVPLSRGAGVQMSAVRANAYLRIASESEGIMAAEEAETTLLVPADEAEEALLVVGSHDPAIDHLANLLRPRGVDIHSAHVGSMGGLLALKKGECHAAPMHLLGTDGSYNIPYLNRYMPGEELVLLCVAERQQGIVSRDGLGLEDLATHSFVNRQKGSGTRILLDYLLKEQGIDPEGIDGYSREMTTHLAVALAVQSGDADAGMCVYSAAKALDLKFVPVGTERYELVARKSVYESDPRLETLFAGVASDQFREVLTRLGGYDITETGVMRELS